MKRKIARVCRGIARRLDPQSPPPTSIPQPLTEKHDLLDKMYCCLQKLGFNPRHIIDIGANRGDWTRTTRKYFPEACYTLVEPQQSMRDHMQDLLADESRIVLHTCGAGAHDGELAFTIADRDDSCNFSMTKEEAEKYGFKQIRVPVVSLDSLLKSSSWPAPEMIKIDAEGCDLDVLEGATESLKSCHVLLVEAAVMCKSFRNTLPEIINRTSALGFVPFDITDMNRTQKHGALWLMEIGFIRSGGHVQNQIASYA